MNFENVKITESTENRKEEVISEGDKLEALKNELQVSEDEVKKLEEEYKNLKKELDSIDSDIQGKRASYNYGFYKFTQEFFNNPRNLKVLLERNSNVNGVKEFCKKLEKFGWESASESDKKILAESFKGELNNLIRFVPEESLSNFPGYDNYKENIQNAPDITDLEMQRKIIDSKINSNYKILENVKKRKLELINSIKSFESNN